MVADIYVLNDDVDRLSGTHDVDDSASDMRCSIDALSEPITVN